MGRHPDPRPAAEQAAIASPLVAPAADLAPPLAAPANFASAPRRSRRSRLAARLIAIVLTIVLGGWAGFALAATVSSTRQVAAAGSQEPPTPAASAASASPAPSDLASAGPSSAPPPSQPIAAGDPLPRPRVTTVPVRARLQSELDRIRKRLAIPGVSATITFRDGTSWTGTSGLADVGRKKAVADDTAFAVGSVSKTYTAALILALVGDGKIDLDAPATKYVPTRPLDPRITVRMLLNHTSGLDDFFIHGTIDTALQKEPSATWSVKRTLRFVSKPYFPPGTGYHYSNTNYLYLGLIAETVTGTPLGAALRDRFFGPLGLDSTWYQAAEKPRAPTSHGYRFAGSSRSAAPIDLSDGTGVMPFTSVVTAAGGAGSIATTSADAVRWARLLYSGEVLGPEMTAEMLGSSGLTAPYRPRVPYGLGVQEFSIDGRPTVGHSGTLLGYRAAVRHLPAEATTIAVLTNQSRTDPGIIVQGLLDVVFAPEPDCLFRCQTPT